MEISRQLVNSSVKDKEERAMLQICGQVNVKEVEWFLESNRQWRKEGRNGTLVLSALHSILHGWLAQINDFLVVFGAGTFRAKVVNRPLRESESHWALQ